MTANGETETEKQEENDLRNQFGNKLQQQKKNENFPYKKKRQATKKNKMK